MKQNRLLSLGSLTSVASTSLMAMSLSIGLSASLPAHAAGTLNINNGGNLLGSGTLGGDINAVSGGGVASTGCIASQNLTLGSGSTLTIDLNGSTACTNYDQLQVTGTVNVTNANLSISGSYGMVPFQILTIVANDGSDAVTGNFSGLPEKGRIMANSQLVYVSYAGDTGNDITLTFSFDSVDDYTAAGVTGVNASIVHAVNEMVYAASHSAVDTAGEIQAIVNTVLAAQLVITNYATSNANTAPTISDYTNYGVTGVTSDNLAAINATVDAAAAADVDTTVEVQTMVDNIIAALQTVVNWATNPVTAPTLTTYNTLHISNMNADRVATMNYRALQAGATGVDTIAEIQALTNAFVTALQKISNYAAANTNPAPVENDYNLQLQANTTNTVTANTIAAMNLRVDALTATDVDTPMEVTLIMASVDAAKQSIESYALSGANPAPVINAYTDFAISGVTSDNLAAVNAQVEAVSETQADSHAEVQALASIVTTAHAVITAYATANTNPAPVLTDYSKLLIAGVTSDNLAAVNNAVDATNAAGVDTIAEIQALVTTVDDALMVITNYATSNTNPAPTVANYTTAGVTGVTSDNLAAVNAQVDALSAMNADSIAEVQSAVTIVTNLHNVIKDYATSNTNTAPQLSDFMSLLITGVIPDNLAAVNAAIDATDSAGVDTLAEIQALVTAIINALQKITLYAAANTNPVPTVADYATAGVTGVTSDNLAAVNFNVDAVAAANADSIAEVQFIVTNVSNEHQIIKDYATSNTNTAPQLINFTNLAISGVTSANLATVNAAIDATDSAGVDTLAEVQALVTGINGALQIITNYAASNTNPAPTVANYATAGVTGVTSDNLAAVNFNVDAVAASNADSIVEVQGIVTIVTNEHQVIKDYATSNTNPAPQLINFTTLAISGVTSANLATVNAAIDATDVNGVDTLAEVQAIVTAINNALQTITNYAASNTNPTPTVADYTTAGVTGVSSDNLAAVNFNVDSTSAANADSIAEVQSIVTIVTNEHQLIQNYATNNSNTTPDLNNYTTLAISGVDANNLTVVNAAIDATDANGVDTLAEIQALVNAINAAVTKISNYAASNTNPAPTVADYSTAGVTAVTSDNLAAVNHNIDLATATDVDTTSEIQGMVTVVSNEHQVIINYATSNTNTAPSVNNFELLAITGVVSENLSVVNAAIDATDANGVDTLAEIQAIVTPIVNALQKLVAYATSNTNPVPTVSDYSTAGVTAVTSDNLAAANHNLDVSEINSVNTLAGIQSMVNNIATTHQVIINYATSNTNTTPTLSTYTSLAISGVTADNLAAVNAGVDETDANGVDTLAEVQVIATAAAAAVTKIADYANNNSNPAPTLADYTTAGITGVTSAYLSGVNGHIDSLSSAQADSVAEIQAQVTGFLASDSDADGMPYSYEIDNGLNPAVNDATGDLDSDNINNITEYNNGTNPNGIQNSAKETELLISPRLYRFGVETLNDASCDTNSTAVTYTVSNKATGSRTLGPINFTGPNASEFAVKSGQDNCGGQTIASMASCTFQLIFCPTSVGDKAAMATLSTNDTETPQLTAALYNGESDQDEAERRLPPVLSGLTIRDSGNSPVVSGELNEGEQYTVEWVMTGYHNSFASTAAIFNCDGQAAGTCGDNFGDNAANSGLLTNPTIGSGAYTYNGITAKTFTYSYTFTAPSVTADTQFVIRFYRKSSEDVFVNNASLSLMLPGNVNGASYYDTSGRRLSVTIKNQ